MSRSSNSDATPRTSLEEQLQVLREKLAFFLEEEVLTTDLDKKFTLKKEVEKLRPKIAELEGRIQPRYENLETERLSRLLEELYDRKEKQKIAGADCRAVDREILDVRQQLRKGPQLRAGEMLAEGRFKLIEPLGQGGFATVWKVYDRRRQELVALKVLHGQHSKEATLRERFFRGAKKMTELRHPNSVHVLEPRLEDDGWCFFAMELVTGGDLHRAVVDGELRSLDEKLDVLVQVGQALGEAHDKGLIHRDVKPSNVLLERRTDGSWKAKLTDFDLVRARDTVVITDTQAMLGTLQFAAPESLQSARQVGPAADVYSLGATAVFALRGGLLPPDFYRHPRRTVAELDVSEDLREVLARAMAPEAAERFPSMAQLCEALRLRKDPHPPAKTRGEPEPREEPEPTPVTEVSEGRRRRRRLLRFGLVALSGLVLFLGWWWISSWQVAAAERDAEEAARLAASRPQEALRLALGALRRAETFGRPRLVKAENALRKGLAVCAGTPVPLGHGEKVEAATFHDGEIWLATTDLESSQQLSLWRESESDAVERPWSLDGKQIMDVQFSPDGRWLATWVQDTALYLADLDLSPDLREVSRSKDWRDFFFSQDSRFLVSKGEVLDLQTGKPAAGGAGTGMERPRCLPEPNKTNVVVPADLDPACTGGRRLPAVELRGHDENVLGAAVDREGRRLLTWSAVDARWWNLRSSALAAGREPRVPEDDEEAVRILQATKDARLLASVGRVAPSLFWRALGCEGVPEGHEDPPVAFSPDHNWLVLMTDGGRVCRWDLRAGWNVRPTSLEEVPDKPGFVSVSNGGEWLAVADRDGLHLYKGGARIRTISGDVRAGAFSPDSHWLVTVNDPAPGVKDADVRVWDLGQEGRSFELRSLKVGRYLLTFSPRSDWFLGGSVPGGARLWRMKDLKPKDVSLPRQKDLQVMSVEGATSSEWNRLVTGMRDGSIGLWELGAREKRRLLRGHEDAVTALAMSGDGDWLASGDRKGNLRLWDLNKGGAEPIELGQHAAAVGALAFAPGRLVSFSTDAELRTWTLGLEDLVQLVEETVEEPSG